MRIAVAQLGARMHYAVPRIFHEAGMLEQLFTDSYVGNKPRLEAALRAVPRAVRLRAVERWLGRAEPHLPANKVTSFEGLGLRYALAQCRARRAAGISWVFAEHGRAFNERIIAHGLGAADTVWGYNGASVELFQWAKRRGLRCLLEQTMAPQRALRGELIRELERWPGWEPGLQLLEVDSPLADREEAEWRLADRILAGSGFVIDGLSTCGPWRDKCRVVPYGVGSPKSTTAAQCMAAPHPRLRILFVGEVGLRKGAPYLLEAVRRLGPKRVEARLAGRIALDPSRLAPYAEMVGFLGAVPRSAMASLYEWADLLVLPSLWEGSAVATYEALARGVPVICTPNTGSIIRDGIDGHVVPTRDVDALVELLDHYAARPEELDRLRHAAHKSASIISYESYAERLLAAIGAMA
jgi:glycosyltransferase involved in cell wall biosynthesis